MAGAITLVIVAAGPMFVRVWVTRQAPSGQDISQATVLMGLGLACNGPRCFTRRG